MKQTWEPFMPLLINVSLEVLAKEKGARTRDGLESRGEKIIRMKTLY